MQVSGITTLAYLKSGVAEAKSKASSEAQKVDKAFADMLNPAQEPEDMLQEITQDGASGLWKWQIKQLKAKIAAEMMGEMNLTPEALAAMPEAQRISIEQKIMQAVEQRVQEIIRESMEKKKSTLGAEASAAAGGVDITA